MTESRIVFGLKMNRIVVPFSLSSRKHLRTNVTPDLHLTYSKNGGNLGVGIKTIKTEVISP